MTEGPTLEHPTASPDALSAPASIERARSPRRGGKTPRAPYAFLVLMALMLEALPVATWLAVLGDVGALPQPAALSFGAIVAVLVTAMLTAALGRRISASRNRTGANPHHAPTSSLASTLFIVLVALIGYMATVLLVLQHSPALNSQTQRTQIAVLTGTTTTTAPLLIGFGLVTLVSYLWWRGLRLTSEHLAHDSISRRFTLGLGAILLAIVGVMGIPGPGRASLEAMLSLALPAEVFCGLLGSSLAHGFDLALASRGRRGAAVAAASARQTFTRSWLTTTLSICGVVAMVALVAGLFVSAPRASYGLGSVFALFAPLGHALAAGLQWLSGLIASFFALFTHHAGTAAPLPTHARPCSTPQSMKDPSCKSGPQPTDILFPFLLLALAVMFFLLVTVLRSSPRSRPSKSFDEERTGLDARDVLTEQVHDFFHRRSRRIPTLQEALRPGSVRALYRDLLRAARHAGYPRQAGETPAEYATRLAALAGATLPAAALDAITHAYYPSRYAPVAVASEGADGQAPPALRDAFGAVSQWLSAHPAPRVSDAISSRAHGRRNRRARSAR